MPFLDCTSDDACPGGHCIEVWEGGFYACQTPPIEATECTGNSEDECCDSSECESTPCLSSDSYPWFGPDRPATFNLCGRESCVTDEDCTNDQVCLPGGVLGHPMSSCISALCRTDADCSEYANGLCAPVEDECYGGVAVFDCVYPGTGACRSNSDCSADSPPFELGESYCDSGRCVEVLQGSVCP